MRLAHVTDLHMGAEDAAVVAGLRADLVAVGPDRILVSGDLTMRARGEQFRAARALLESTGRPWTCVPGNHDLPLDRPRRAFGALRAYRDVIDREPEPVVRDDGLLLLGLSTARPYLWKGGLVDDAQLARIGTAFGPRARLKVLMLHHPVFRSAQRPQETLVHGHERALRAAAEAGVDVILCGHDHVAAQAELPGRVIGVMSGTACSRRLRAGESQSYTVLDLDGDGLRLSVRHWDGGGFVPGDATEWRRSAGGWQRRQP
ncbi:metallophosphoesterase family protein [Actinoplanes sp. URMC 104]|uniref:metallophosphoesterase family protein n=1 Tax=Actinoplanes sp. URMC 104 TaxID=3423409 RepID=UPI003F1B8134